MTPANPRVGVIGSGYWGKNIVRDCRELGVLRVVCDRDAGALQQVRERWPDVVTTTDVGECLSHCDAVIIAAPVELHAPIALECISAGKHVFVEKPLALSVADAQAVADAAIRHDVVAFVGHVLLYHPAVQAMLAEIRRGSIGGVRHFRARRLSLGKLRARESVWWSFAVHDVSVMLELFDSSPEEIRASQFAVRNTNLADFAYADFVFPNGASAHIEVSWLDPVKSSRFDVFGTKGVLTLEDSPAGATLILRPAGASSLDGSSLETWRGPDKQIECQSAQPLKEEIRGFLDAVRTRRATVNDASRGVEVVRVLAAADAAMSRVHATVGS